MMSAFNRIGGTWAGGSYPLLTSLLREEWGFKGVVITDYNLTPYMNVDQMIRAGGDLNLSAGKDFKDVDSAVAVTSLRRASKNVLYAVANSNAMNGLGEGVRISYNKAVWEIILIVCDCVLFLALAAYSLTFHIKTASAVKAGAVFAKIKNFFLKSPIKRLVLIRLKFILKLFLKRVLTMGISCAKI